MGGIFSLGWAGIVPFAMGHTQVSLFLSIPCLALEASVSGLEHHLLIPQLHRRSSQSITSFPLFTSPAGRAWRAQAECMDSTFSWGSLRLSRPARDSPWLSTRLAGNDSQQSYRTPTYASHLMWVIESSRPSEVGITSPQSKISELWKPE